MDARCFCCCGRGGLKVGRFHLPYTRKKGAESVVQGRCLLCAPCLRCGDSNIYFFPRLFYPDPARAKGPLPRLTNTWQDGSGGKSKRVSARSSGRSGAVLARESPRAGSSSKDVPNARCAAMAMMPDQPANHAAFAAGRSHEGFFWTRWWANRQRKFYFWRH